MGLENFNQNKQKEKLFYTMGEVASMFDLSVSNIRFWANEFDILKPQKNGKGNRMFTPKDLESLRLIYHLVRERGLTLKGAKQKLKENKDDVDYSTEVVTRLKNIKRLLLEIQDEM